tara:strand:+ start:24 stop:386 length:363 start_codon:yes stop_codon:yes gene_type:complete
MGLDQMAHKTMGNIREDGSSPVNIQFGEWRKHSSLQGWMANLWRSKQTEEGDFNCVDLELNSQDLNDLEEAVVNGNLPETSGFFFGSGADDHYKSYDLEFIANAREAIKDGFKVIYSSWW